MVVDLAQQGSAKAVSDIVGCSRQAVAQFVAEGMPAGPAGRGVRGRRIPFAQAQAWLARRAVLRARADDGSETLAQAMLRKARADADLAEMRASAKRADLAEAKAVAQVADAVMATAARQLDAFVARVVVPVAQEPGAAAVRQLLFAEGRRARAAMAGDLEVIAAGADT